MLRLSIFLCVLCVSIPALRAQDFGEFLGVDIVRSGIPNPAPALDFRDEVQDRQATIKLGFEGLQMLNDRKLISLVVAHDAPQVGLVLEESGLGVGTFFPKEALHVYGNGIGNGAGFEEARIRVENSGSLPNELRTMFQLVNHGPSRFELENTSTNQIWAFQTNNSDNFLINRLGSGGNEFSIRKSGMVTMGPGGLKNFILHPNGNLEIAGSISQMSDRNQKTAIRPLDVNDVLDRVNQIPITSWQYRDDPASVRHIGPMAQDFYVQFSLGDRNTSISSIDSGGVALAAIQALSQQLEEQGAAIEQLQAEIAAIRPQR